MMVTSSPKFNQNIWQVLQIVEKDLFLRQDGTATLYPSSNFSVSEIFEVVRFLEKNQILNQVGSSSASTMVWNGNDDSLDSIKWILVKVIDRTIFDKANKAFQEAISEKSDEKYFRYYDPERYELVLGNKKYVLPFVKLNNAAKLMEALTQDPDHWLDQDVALEALEMGEAKARRQIYDIAGDLKLIILKATNISDFLITERKRIRINPIYLNINS